MRSPSPTAHVLAGSSVIDLGENLLSWLTIPCKRQISLMLVGVANFAIAETLSGSAVIPRSSTTCPKYSTNGWANVHFSEFSVTPISLGHCRTCLNQSSCSSCVVPWTRISSIRHTVPGSPLSASSLTVLWC